jgi:glutamate formiminotransferase
VPAVYAGRLLITEKLPLLECVVNVSEGRNRALVTGLAAVCGRHLLDVHSDPDHHRAVLTLAGYGADLQDSVRALATEAVASIDMAAHQGAHPRFGALDVVPWVSLAGWPVSDGRIQRAITARNEFARWAGDRLGVPCFLYGPERSLPDVRRQAWRALHPDTGPGAPHPRAGAVAVGARPILIAYNLWLAEPDLGTAQDIAATIRGPAIRALALTVGDHVQVSCNLIDPWAVGPAMAFDAVASRAAVWRAELVGLAPGAVLDSIPRHRWRELDLDPTTTIEARLEQAGLDGGRFVECE